MRKAAIAALVLMFCPALSAAQRAGAKPFPNWIEATARKVERTLTTGDAAGLAAMYTDDAVDIESGMQPWVGRRAIEKSNADFLKANKVTSMKVTPLEFQSEGGLGWERGEYTMVFTPKGGKAVTDHSRYLIVWKRGSDGQWKIHRFLGSPAA